MRESARWQAEESRSMASNVSAKMSVSEGKLETGRWGRCDRVKTAGVRGEPGESVCVVGINGASICGL